MDAYFLINPGIYTSDELKLALILSKMGTGKGIAFSEKWYDKLKSTTLKPEDKTLEKFVEDYNGNFNPLDAKVALKTSLQRHSLRINSWQSPSSPWDSTDNSLP